ncbi:hydrolase [Corynebacterium atypicum]|uniref:Hydrolase n=1 Tax=Corynebacterium atypicum TaxID=191610 RepID=A0ABN4DFN1_9CORY|nr:zinc-dependent metalloprotease [Corynebacterium atypicum]AIG63807.1 hydrolase [Corynebacterium atypicum]
MTSGGFGFSFGNDDDDENGRKDDRQQNPFGAFFMGPGMGNSGGQAGGLGDILSQFGQMLSGMGSSMNSPEGQGPVNYEVAMRIAVQQVQGRPDAVRQQDASAVEESARLAELWLNDATTLPASEAKVAAWSPKDWLTETLPMWKRMVTPVAEHMSQAQLDSVPEQAREMIGPMANMMQQMYGMNFGMQLGHALGDLAGQTLTGSDFGIPVAPQGTTALLPSNIQPVAKELGVPVQEFLVYTAAREAARQRLFRHVPWLVERLVSSVEEYAQGLVIDTSHIEEAAREMNLESGDPQAIQEAIEKLQNMDLSPKISSRNASAVTRLETLLALVEGWVELVVTEAMGERIPSTSAMNEAWRRRRATGGSAEQAFSKVVGIEFAAPKVAEATELWRRAETAVGIERRDRVWDHPDFLPTASDLENSAEFIDGLLAADDGDSFDPISEIEELERQLAQDQDGEGGAADTDDDPATDEGPENRS